MLLFHVKDNRFACIVEQIVEIVPKIQLHPLPESPPYIAGVINYRGDTIPVVDLCQLLENDRCFDRLHTRIIVVQSKDHRYLLGVIAERVTEMLDIDPLKFRRSEIKFEKFPYLNGVYTERDLTICLFLIEEFIHDMKKHLFGGRNDQRIS